MFLGNHFWTCLYTSRLIPEPFTADRDREVLQHGIGLCNVVSRTTASGQDLSSSEIREGCRRLVDKLSTLQVTLEYVNKSTIIFISRSWLVSMESQYGSLSVGKCSPGHTKSVTSLSAVRILLLCRASKPFSTLWQVLAPDVRRFQPPRQSCPFSEKSKI